MLSPGPFADVDINIICCDVPIAGHVLYQQLLRQILKDVYTCDRWQTYAIANVV